MQIQKAKRIKKKIRMSIAGPSGSGKTMSALKVAKGLCGNMDKVVVIDTENESAADYADVEGIEGFSTLILHPPFDPSRYVSAIQECEKAGFEVIIIDSVSHAWIGKGGALDIQANLGGKYQDWKKVTPVYQGMLDKILYSSAHVISCLRAKQEHAMVEKNGKTSVEKMGMGAQVRDGFEYEMTIAIELLMNHCAVVGDLGKDRTGLFASVSPHILDEQDGIAIARWCNSGVDDTSHLLNEVIHKVQESGLDAEKLKELTGFNSLKGRTLEELEQIKLTLSQVA